MANASCCSRLLSRQQPQADWSCEIPSRSGVNVAKTLSLFAVGVAGNLLALLVLLRRTPTKSRTLFYTLLTALILNDMVGQVLTSSAPLIVYGTAAFNASAQRLRLTWLGGHATCQAHAFVMTAMALSTPLLVLCMSVERVLCLKLWQNYSHEQQHRKARLCLLIVFGLAFLLAGLPLVGAGAYSLQFPGTWCFVRSHSTETSHQVYAAWFGSWNLILIGLIAVCNIVVIHSLLAVRRLRKTVLRESRSGYSTSPSAVYRTDQPLRQHRGSNASGGGGHRLMRHMELQLVLLLVAITITFALCWSPLMVRVLWNALGGTPDCVEDLKAVYAASINQVLDPWLYILLRRGILQRGWSLARRLAAAAVGCTLRRRRGGRARCRACMAAAGAAAAAKHGAARELHPSKLNNSTSERADAILRDANPAVAVAVTAGRCGCRCHVHLHPPAAGKALPDVCNIDGGGRQRSRSLPEGRLLGCRKAANY